MKQQDWEPDYRRTFTTTSTAEVSTPRIFLSASKHSHCDQSAILYYYLSCIYVHCTDFTGIYVASTLCRRCLNKKGTTAKQSWPGNGTTSSQLLETLVGFVTISQTVLVVDGYVLPVHRLQCCTCYYTANDAIRGAIVTCAQELTRLGLIYHMEPTTKRKTKK